VSLYNAGQAELGICQRGGDGHRADVVASNRADASDADMGKFGPGST